MPLKNGALTKREQAFVEAFGRAGDRVAAAREAGYASPEVQGHHLLARPAIAQAAEAQLLEGLRAGVLEGVPILRKLQAGALKDSDKVAAARALQDFYGKVLDRLGIGADKELHEMTADELRQKLGELDRLQARHDAVDVIAEPLDPGIFD
jgi:phage terminase small subunit